MLINRGFDSPYLFLYAMKKDQSTLYDFSLLYISDCFLIFTATTLT